jgi:Flp pilus assembly protein CpaB
VTPQRALLVLAIVAGALSGAIYYSTSQRVGVMFAAAHLSPGQPISESDVEMRWLPADAVPADALTDAASAIGRFPRAPQWPGQVLLTGSLASATATFESGLIPPTGYRAVAIPVVAHQALGGAIAPGARVDVIAVPLPGRDQTERLAELLTEAALVIDVRGEHGGSIRIGDHSSAAIAVPERLGSVVIAIGASEELMIAERIVSSTFVLVLVPPIR